MITRAKGRSVSNGRCDDRTKRLGQEPRKVVAGVFYKLKKVRISRILRE